MKPYRNNDQQIDFESTCTRVLLTIPMPYMHTDTSLSQRRLKFFTNRCHFF